MKVIIVKRLLTVCGCKYLHNIFFLLNKQIKLNVSNKPTYLPSSRCISFQIPKISKVISK